MRVRPVDEVRRDKPEAARWLLFVKFRIAAETERTFPALAGSAVIKEAIDRRMVPVVSASG